MIGAVHFVRFRNLHDQHYQNAVQVFGPPHFVHRRWDNRAHREIAPGDVVVFANGEHDQPVTSNGDDQHYYITEGIGL